MANNTLLILLVSLLLVGCSTHSKKDLIYESRYADKQTGQRYLKQGSSYCVRTESPLLKRYGEFFKSYLPSAWQGHAIYSNSCENVDYTVSLGYVNHFSLPRSSEREYTFYKSKGVKLTIKNGMGDTVMDFSIGTLRNIDNGDDKDTYGEFIAKHLAPSRIFGGGQ